MKSLKTIHSDPSYDIIGLQVWKIHEQVPDLPLDEAGVLALIEDEDSAEKDEAELYAGQ